MHAKNLELVGGRWLVVGRFVFRLCLMELRSFDSNLYEPKGIPPVVMVVPDGDSRSLRRYAEWGYVSNTCLHRFHLG